MYRYDRPYWWCPVCDRGTEEETTAAGAEDDSWLRRIWDWLD
jgi:hypothetical protein